MKTVKSYAELRNVWASSKPSKATLEQLASILGASGASVKVVSEFWRKVGIAGNVGGLASISALNLEALTSVAHSAPNLEALTSVEHSAADASQARITPDIDLTSGEWAAVATGLVLAGGILITISGGAGLVLPALVVLFTGEGAVTLATFGLVEGVALQIGGLVAVGTGLMESISSHSAAPPPVCICPPSGGTNNFPVNATTADAGVMSTTVTPEAFGGFNAPELNVTSLPPNPPPQSGPVPTSGPEPTPVPTSGPGPTEPP